MLKNYLKIALRNLRRYKGYTAINVTGLAVGTACCLLIMLYVRDELSYDRHHDNAERIVRVLVGEEQTFTPTVVGPLFTREFPEVETAARLYPLGMFRPIVVRYGERAFEESRFFYADSTVFDVFTLPFVAGTPQNALTRPETLVLTASTARKYFGAENPVGQIVQVGSGVDYEVTGVIEDLPSTSHVQFDVLGSFVSTHWATEEQWGSANFFTFLLLQDEQAVASLNLKVAALLDRVREGPSGKISAGYFLTLQPLTRIHLYFDGRITYVYLFAALAVLILLVACANYMNLATARSARRAREVGIRKMAGAHRRQLAFQFFGESAVLVFGALALAVLLAEALLPAFNAVSGKQLALRYLDDPWLLPALLGLGVAVSLVAGGYPALLLSSFRPAQVLKGTLKTGLGGAAFRKVLVVFQFGVTVFLIAGTLIVYRQLDYMGTKNLGFDKEQVVVLSIGDRVLRETYATLK
ncbi:MAG: ABC transporter permease, partial [Bacteroidetes bacterium]|nr:ABC transporter permease [Bacteroidota bacterium]